MVLALLIIAAEVLLDQLIKGWAVNTLKNIGSMPLIRNVFHFTYVENIGAAFSIMPGRRWFFVFMTSLILVVIAILIGKGAINHPLGRISLYMVTGGAIGNLIDRVRTGYVVDMFDFRLIRFAIFNAADSFITVGGILFIIYFIFIHDRKSAAQEAEGENGD